jgi:hypothetical protein
MRGDFKLRDLAWPVNDPIYLMTRPAIRANLTKACEPAIAQEAGQ